jgi:hypothetical protein
MVVAVRTLELGGGAFNVNRFVEQISADNLAVVHKRLREIAIERVAEQQRLGNEPTRVEVDSSAFKPITVATRNVTVYFGNKLIKAAMLEVESLLRAAIDASTTARTGALRNIQQNWEWVLIRGYGSTKPGGVVTPSSVEALGFGYTDRVILRPKLHYATAVNQNVAGGRKGLSVKRRGKSAKETNKRRDNIGFFGHAAQSLRRNALFKTQFSVVAGFSSYFLAPGEVATAGKGGSKITGFLMISNRRRGRL